jgi:hypothetical protein
VEAQCFLYRAALYLGRTRPALEYGTPEFEALMIFIRLLNELEKDTGFHPTFSFLVDPNLQLLSYTLPRS